MPAKLRVESLEDRAVPAVVAPQAFDPDRVLVTFTTSKPNPAQVTALRNSPLAEGAEALGFGVYRVDLSAGTSVTTAIHNLSSVAGVQAVQPDYRVNIAATPNDPSFATQTALTRIGAPAAWNVTTGTGTTIVAVIDTGVDTAHPDLVNNLWRNPRETPGNGLDDDRNGFVDDVFGADFANNDGNPTDDNSHGTHVAGIIGAVGNNGLGGTGVAWTTRIMALKFSGADGGGFTSNAVRALDYAVANGAKVVNNSWGGTGYDAALLAAINRARAAGVIVVAAAGNSAADTDATPFYPAGYVTQADNVVSVAATTDADGLASYSNFGRSTVTLAAPGTSILSTLPGNRYGQLSGTSMASPFVTGALALLWDRNPTWSYSQVIAKLKQSVAPLSVLVGKTQTGGRLDVARLLDATAPPVERTGPSVTAMTFTGAKPDTFDRVQVTFSEAINPTTFTAADISAAVGPAGAIRVSAVAPVTGTGNTQFNVLFALTQTMAGTYTMTIGPDIRDAAGNAMDQNRNGVNGEATADRLAGLGSLAAPTVPPVSPPPTTQPGRRQLYAATLSQAIQDRRTTRIEFTVTDTVAVSDLAIQLPITHSRVSDLQIRLVAPDGRIVTLFNRRGGSGANLDGTVFNDRATVTLASASAPFTGTYRPEQPLSSLDGLSARGVWVIQIFDLASGATGTVHGVVLSIATPTTGQRVQTVPSVQQLPTATRLASLTDRDLRGTTEAVQAAVLMGREDTIAPVPVVPPQPKEPKPIEPPPSGMRIDYGQADVTTPAPVATPAPRMRKPVELPQGEAILEVALALWPLSVDFAHGKTFVPPTDAANDYKPVEVC